MEALQDIVAHLRAPDGCPWDRDLTWDKLRASLLEETHELLAALDAQAPGKVREELGDLLLQIALITQIASGRRPFPPARCDQHAYRQTHPAPPARLRRSHRARCR